MAQARARRGALAILTGAALLVAPAVFLLTPASAAGPVITVLNSKGYVDPFDGDVIVGELQNTGDAASGLVEVDVTWLDAANNPIGNPEFLAASTVEVIPPGTPLDRANRSPFRGRVTPPPAYDHYGLTTISTAANAALNHNFDVRVTSRSVDSNGYNHLLGTVTNLNDVTAEFVNVVVTLYDGNGKADDEAVELSSPNSSLAPGATGTFDAVSDSSGRSYATYTILAQSSTQGSAPVSPSPSASASATATPSASVSATPTPTASATASPTPTASPTATAAPLPCRTDGGTYAIATSPSYIKIVKGTTGGHVRLYATVSQAGRPCQSGVRLSVYVRGPGTTLYHLSKSAVTGSTGKAYVDYTGVKADFRWYVVSSGAHSATNLVQVR